MADFIHFEAEVSGTDGSENENENDLDEMKSFINDDTESENDNDNNENFEFVNSEINIDEANQRIEQEALPRIQDCDDYSNLSYTSEEDESSVFEFPNSENHIDKFKNSLFPKNTENIHHNFVLVILYKIRQIIDDKTDICDDEALKENETIKDIIEKMSDEKFKFSLDLQEFNHVCYEINEILIKYNFFLRVFEQKNKYRNLLIKQPEKQNQIKQLASCLNQKYNGFQVIKNLFNKRERREFVRVDIIYTRRAFTIYECYYCNKFFRQKNKKDLHLKVCSGKPRIVYNFCSQTLTSFEDNYGAKGDVPFSIYFDFETTSPTDSEMVRSRRQKNVCYVLCNYSRFPSAF